MKRATTTTCSSRGSPSSCWKTPWGTSLRLPESDVWLPRSRGPASPNAANGGPPLDVDDLFFPPDINDCYDFLLRYDPFLNHSCEVAGVIVSAIVVSEEFRGFKRQRPAHTVVSAACLVHRHGAVNRHFVRQPAEHPPLVDVHQVFSSRLTP